MDVSSCDTVQDVESVFDLCLGGLPYSKFSFGVVYLWIHGRNFVLQRCVSGAVKHNFRKYMTI